MMRSCRARVLTSARGGENILDTAGELGRNLRDDPGENLRRRGVPSKYRGVPARLYRVVLIDVVLC